MGEAKRRKQAGQLQGGQGALPDAMFLRRADLELHGLVLVGNLHVLRPPSDEAVLMQRVSKLADQLMDPERVPLPDDPAVMQMWADPAQGWNYGLAETLAIKRLLPGAAIVRVMMRDIGAQCVFGYEPVTERADELNRVLADGLIAPRPG